MLSVLFRGSEAGLSGVFEMNLDWCSDRLELSFGKMGLI
jgi:hypothetical protein